MAKRPKRETGDEYDVEDIMGMFLLAFGQGVDPLHVHRYVIREARKIFRPKISDVVLNDPDWNEKWKAESATVLGWMSAVGCLATQIAMEPKLRRTVVDVKDFTVALEAVIAEHKRSSTDQKVLGRWCM